LKSRGRTKETSALQLTPERVCGAVLSGDLRRVGNLYDPPPGYKDDLIVWDFIWTRISSWDSRAALVSSAPNLEKHSNNSECRKGETTLNVDKARDPVIALESRAAALASRAIFPRSQQPFARSELLFLKILYTRCRHG
jgi:hypothetical protein